MEPVFSQTYSFTYHHIDWRGIAAPMAYWELMQDAATRHARMAHLDRDDLPILWVLSRMQATFSRPLSAHQSLTLSTWCAGIKGVSWIRAFSFSVAGQPVGEAISTWVILDPVSHRILRPTTVPAATTYPRLDLPTLPLPQKLHCANLPLHHTYTVRYSDLDINQHLNNVRIAALVCDALDFTHSDFITSLQINYTAETTIGTTLSLHAVRDETTFRVCGIAADTVRFEAAGTIDAMKGN